MGVDLSTYCARIGTFVNCGVFKSVQHGVILHENCSSAKFHIGLAVYFVSLLLICGAVELNSGPTRKRCTACGIYQNSSYSYFQFPYDYRSVWRTS